MMRCLGRLPHDPARVAAVEPFVSPGGEAPSEYGVDWSRDVAPGAWGMYGNDTLPNCTAVGMAHAAITWGAYKPPLVVPTQAEVDALFAATGSPDGAVCLDVLEYTKAHGFGRVRLAGYTTVDVKDRGTIMQALAARQGLYVGVTLREADMDGGPWNASNSPIVGGHLIWAVQADPTGLTSISWGQTQRMTWEFWAQAADECYALTAA